MTGIQILLLIGLVILFAYYFFRVRNALIDLIILLAFMAVSIFFVLFPENANTVAHKLGVGRGADLLFYCCILFFAFLVMKLFNRIHQLERKLTELVKENAKQNAIRLRGKDK